VLLCVVLQFEVTLVQELGLFVECVFNVERVLLFIYHLFVIFIIKEVCIYLLISHHLPRKHRIVLLTVHKLSYWI